MADKLEPLAVSAAEAARLLGVSRPVVYKYIGRADFPAFKLGNRTLIYVDGLREWVRCQAQNDPLRCCNTKTDRDSRPAVNSERRY